MKYGWPEAHLGGNFPGVSNIAYSGYILADALIVLEIP
jgi:hypothetical protein